MTDLTALRAYASSVKSSAPSKPPQTGSAPPRRLLVGGVNDVCAGRHALSDAPFVVRPGVRPAEVDAMPDWLPGAVAIVGAVVGTVLLAALAGRCAWVYLVAHPIGG